MKIGRKSPQKALQNFLTNEAMHVRFLTSVIYNLV